MAIGAKLTSHTRHFGFFYFRRLGHDNHRRLSKLYAWEEKKIKTLSRCLRSCFRPVLPRLQPEAIAWEKLEPSTHRRAVQG